MVFYKLILCNILLSYI